MSLVLPPSGRTVNRDPASWLDRVVRLVPIEIVSPYALAVTIASPRGALALGLAAAGAIATVVVLALHARRHGLTVAPTQHGVRALTFVAWAFVIGNPLAPAAAVDTRIPAALAVAVPALGSLLFAPGAIARVRPRG